jgi:UDP-2,3-diacylglucosamine pyrophosphatase LpxH
VVRHARWLALLGDWAYETALRVNAHVNYVRRRLGLTYWSLSQWAKLKVKNAINFIGEFEQALIIEARHHGVDGIICGHIHHAAIRNSNGLQYINCGIGLRAAPHSSRDMMVSSNSSGGPPGAKFRNPGR